MKNTKAVTTRIKKGDEVIVISGADADSERPRRVIAVYPKTGRVLVEGVNVARRAYRKNADSTYPQGGIHDKTMPIHISNVMLADPNDGGATRVGVRVEQKDGKTVRTRYAKASGTDFKN
ncbi:MAG: 50S ribosomal protein L24 [Chlorobi bacterium CHB2]|nr:50S ribosomal protein L24 [Chlorobi bacterium CHB2]